MCDGAYWGVDSYNPVNSKVWHVKGTPTLFDYVCDQAGRVPDFWGRYITGGKERLSSDEVDYVFRASQSGTRILPIYNQAGPNLHSLKGGAREGANDAGKAIGAAGALGIPPGVFLWCDIEPNWPTTAAWFQGWWDRMDKSIYGGRGGIYENPLPWNEANFATPYLAALKAEADTTTPPQDPPARARYLWSQQYAQVNISAATFPAFTPAEPVGLSNVTVVWQYAIDNLRTGLGKGKGLVDYNVANLTGYNTMWQSSAVPSGCVLV